MTDIVERLRYEVIGEPTGITRMCREAADEIEHLREALKPFAAAPELYEALEWFINDIDGTHTVMVDFSANVERARAALSKARWET